MKFSTHPILAIVLLLCAAAVAPLSVSAEEPNGTFVWNESSNSQGSNVGGSASAISQNGQFVSGQDNAYGYDQTTYPGSRADAVQGQHTAEGRGRSNSNK